MFTIMSHTVIGLSIQIINISAIKINKFQKQECRGIAGSVERNNLKFMRKLLKSVYAPKLVLENGSVEALKWLALVSMTIDHINHFLFNMQVPVMSELGRIAMPLFGFVLAHNLARPDALQKRIHVRTMRRLFIFGLLAAPFFIALKGWLPLNIMFTLLLATYMIYLIEKGDLPSHMLCLIAFTICGAFVDYAWFAPAYCLAAWWFCKSPSLAGGLLWFGMTALLWVANLNYWACVALPIILLASYIKIEVPRLRYVFYAYYPVHLALLLLIQKFMPINL